jgi:hypothetical protein
MKSDFDRQVDQVVQAGCFPGMMDGKLSLFYPGWKSFHLESKV